MAWLFASKVAAGAVAGKAAAGAVAGKAAASAVSGAVAGGAGAAVVPAAGGSLLGQIGSHAANIGMQALAGGPTGAVGMIGQQGFGTIAKQLLQDRVKNNVQGRLGSVGGVMDSMGGSQQTLPGNGPEDTERITADVRPGETLTFTPPGQQPPPNPNPNERREGFGRQMIPMFKHGGQVKGYQEGGQVTNPLMDFDTPDPLVERHPLTDPDPPGPNMLPPLGALPDPANLDPGRRMSGGEKATGVILGILDMLGSKNPAALIRTPRAWGERIRQEQDMQSLRNHYRKELHSFGPAKGEEGWDIKRDNPERREELLYSLSHMDTPKLRDWGYKSRDVVQEGGLTTQEWAYMPGWGGIQDPASYSKVGFPLLTRAGAIKKSAAARSGARPYRDPSQTQQDFDKSRSIYKNYKGTDDDSQKALRATLTTQAQEARPADQESSRQREMRWFLTNPRYIFVNPVTGVGTIDPEWLREYEEIMGKSFNEAANAITEDSDRGPGGVDRIMEKGASAGLLGR